MPDGTSPEGGARRRVVVLVGLPGSGKSTWLDRQHITPLSSDEVRRLLKDDATDQSANSAVFATLRYLLHRRLQLGARTTYIDATNLTAKERRAWVRTADLYGCEAEAVFFDTPLEVCMERNRCRDRVVPEDVLRRFAARMTRPSPEEGFTKVTVVATDAAPSPKPEQAAPQPAQ